jgi:hypothetical protein
MDACRSELESCDQEQDQKQDQKRILKKQKRSFVNLETLDEADSQTTAFDDGCS